MNHIVKLAVDLAKGKVQKFSVEDQMTHFVKRLLTYSSSLQVKMVSLKLTAKLSVSTKLTFSKS
jgi:hypothetical protein